MECLIPVPHTIYYNKAEWERSSACHLSSFRIASPKKAQCARNPGNLGTESIPTNNPSIFNNQISLCITLFRIWGSRESMHVDKKYRTSLSFRGMIRIFIPFECTCSKIVYFNARVSVCAGADRSTCRHARTLLAQQPLSPLHRFLLT